MNFNNLDPNEKQKKMIIDIPEDFDSEGIIITVY